MSPPDLVTGGGGGAASAGGGGGAASAGGGGGAASAGGGAMLQKLCDEKGRAVEDLERALSDLMQRREHVVSEVSKTFRALRVHRRGYAEREEVNAEAKWPIPESELLQLKHTILTGPIVMENGTIRIKLSEQRKFACAAAGTTTSATPELERSYEEKCLLEDKMLKRYKDQLQQFDKYISMLGESAKQLEALQASSPAAMEISRSEAILANTLNASFENNLAQSQTKWLEEQMKTLETNCSNEREQLLIENEMLKLQLESQLKKNLAMLRSGSLGDEGISTVGYRDTPSSSSSSNKKKNSSSSSSSSQSMEYLDILEYANNSMSPVEERTIASYMELLKIKETAPERAGTSGEINVLAHCSNCYKPLVFHQILSINEEVDTPLECLQCGHFGCLTFKF